MCYYYFYFLLLEQVVRGGDVGCSSLISMIPERVLQRAPSPSSLMRRFPIKELNIDILYLIDGEDDEIDNNGDNENES